MLILIFFTCAIFCRVSCQERPTLISPEGNEIIKNAGDPIIFSCIGNKKIFFYYPTNYGSDEEVSRKVISSNIEENETNTIDGRSIYNFSRHKSVPGDTGWYGCSYRNRTITQKDYDDFEFNWVYVYVDSPNSAFVENVVETVKGATGTMAFIPCRPTLPSLEVTLFDQFDEKIEIDDNITYDPKFGYRINNLSLHNSGIFICSITRGGKTYEVNYHLDVFIKQNVHEPKIIMDTLRHVIYGQTLRVNCTIDLQKKLLPFQFKWISPTDNTRMSQRQEIIKTEPNLLHVTKEMIIQNVMEEDEGEYECEIKIHGSSNRAKMNLTIHDPNERYINLTSQDSNRHYLRKENSHVVWVVYYDAFPEVQLKWLYKEKEIMDDWLNSEETKYAVNKTPTTTILRVNRLKLDDSGTYMLEAANELENKSLNFSLFVLAKPTLIFDEIESYYSPDQISDIHCRAVAYPEPEFYWTFLECPYYPSRNNSNLIKLNHTTEILPTHFISKVTMKIRMSGIINCTACNSEGCDSNFSNVIVSDGVKEFGIIEPKGPIVESDDIEVICAASIYNYTNNILWLDSNMKAILENERIKVSYKTTSFTHRAILQIKNVLPDDSMTYYCIGETKDGNNTFEYDLVVNKQKKPSFRYSNLNETDLIIDFGRENHKLIILKCYVNGMPKPKVEWYKGDVKIKNSEQYECKKDNQELYIKFVFENDSGKYSCRAENRLGRIEAYQNITIMGKELPKGLIILIVILVIILIILIVYFTIKFRREKKMRKELLETGLTHFEEGALECLNPELTVDDQAELLPYDKKWEFPRERLKLGKQLGSGAFGVVMKAEAQGISDGETITTVAVKMVRRTTDPTYVRALASELKIMVHLGKHLNVVNLLGACTKNICKRELLVIVEYCRFGNLHNFLLRHRMDFINQIDPSTGKFDPTIGIDRLTRTGSISSDNRIKYAALSFSRSTSINSGSEMIHYYAPNTTDSQDMSMSPDGCILSNNSSQPGWRSNYRGDYKDHNLKPICTQDLLSWAFQVARGMEYLSQRKVLHGDLAARNILLAENNIVKICDFGLAKTMYKDGNYKKKGDGPLPIKWMAIESIRDRVFSTQSDIWSFGIVLWEFFTLAETPYPGMEAEKQYQKLIEGYRMEQPAYATPDVYNIMLQCWKAKPTLRPGFTELVESIGDLLEESVKTHYITLNTPYMDMNTMILDGKNDYLTMMSAPDHTVLSLPVRDYVNSPISENPPDSAYLCMSPSNNGDESGIFSPRMDSEKLHFEFPSVTSDTEDAIELSPMLKNVDDHYLKPINVHERRAEFARKRQIENVKPIERINSTDSGYCNAPRNLHLIDLNGKLRENDRKDEEEEKGDEEEQEKNDHDRTDSIPKRKEYTPSIIRTQDNYVNMPKQKNDLKRDTPDSFSNPSYIMMGKELNHSVV
ncbi:PREDICTED: vascular endothelial growth factor receptor 1 isoform X2 [Polistes canadensis]|uniref:vascular endothelial growth factor receptor 1 isoform X2 n=1 Tax=Polistes canadensis TaxID=91411 RepID=UPI000718E9F3|nr:PREDICTED: vascular endothelial growth factor receptor 1 isoform X2 [Polistes canadensis]